MEDDKILWSEKRILMGTLLATCCNDSRLFNEYSLHRVGRGLEVGDFHAVPNYVRISKYDSIAKYVGGYVIINKYNTVSLDIPVVDILFHNVYTLFIM